jgi:hypothetical protein
MSHGRHRRRRRHGFFSTQTPAQNTTGSGSSQSQPSQSQPSQEARNEDQGGDGGCDH